MSALLHRRWKHNRTSGEPCRAWPVDRGIEAFEWHNPSCSTVCDHERAYPPPCDSGASSRLESSGISCGVCTISMCRGRACVCPRCTADRKNDGRPVRCVTNILGANQTPSLYKHEEYRMRMTTTWTNKRYQSSCDVLCTSLARVWSLLRQGNEQPSRYE
jgi:hypothetical protein